VLVGPILHWGLVAQVLDLPDLVLVCLFVVDRWVSC